MTGKALMSETWTVGEIARELGVTVRTLHHYDEIGLLVPSDRSAAGYRLYTPADLERLQAIVVYRRLDFALDEIRELLDADDSTLVDHLRRQRATVMSRLDEMHGLVAAIDNALERAMNDKPATAEDLKEIFGDGYTDEYQAEAQERWGDTEAWRQSKNRTAAYTKADWERIKAEGEQVNAAFVAAKRSGQPATSEAAMDAAEEHRRQIDTWFYDTGYDMHRCLGDMYIADPRFTRTYDDLEPGLAQYVRDAIHANADRH